MRARFSPALCAGRPRWWCLPSTRVSACARRSAWTRWSRPGASVRSSRPGDRRAGDYLLAVGTLQPRKNLEAAFAAFERLERTDLRLVVAGARGWGDEAVVARARRSAAAARIQLAGRVGDAELVELYRNAACLVFPSRGEGFGFPALEAMACGTPVVAARSGSLPEVLGDAAPLVDPDDVHGLVDAVEQVLADPQPWRDRGLARAAGFTWARCAEETVAVYRSAIA